MAVREIDEAELLSAQAVVRSVNQMLGNPAARKMLLQARKAADPTAVIPEIDAAAPVQAEVAEIRKLIAEDQAARAKERSDAEQQRVLDDFRRGWEAQKATLRASGWRDEGIAEIEKHAQERGIGDLEIAAAHWEKLHPPAEPVQPNGSGSWGFFDEPQQDDVFIKKMFDSRGDDESALNAEISAALRDHRAQAATARR
jgi:hypothetical protein